MPGYKTHIIFGLIISIGFGFLMSGYLDLDFFNFSLIELFFSIPVVLVYSLLPDIDLHSSKISHLFRGLALLFVLLAIIFDLKKFSITIIAVLIIMEFLKHRKFIHSITAGLILSLPLIYFSPILSIFAFIAYLSHLLLDRNLKLA